MRYNPDKCHVLMLSRKKEPTKHQYTPKGYVLESLDSFMYLGVDINSKLTWDQHINRISAKANQTLGFVKRNVQTTSRATKELAYKALVRPQMEYGAVIWDPTQQNLKDELEKVQRRAARYVMNIYLQTSSVTQMLHQLQWETLKTKKRNIKLIMLYKIQGDHRFFISKFPDFSLIFPSFP